MRLQVVHLDEGLLGSDAVALLQPHHLLVDAVELVLVVLVEGHLTEPVQCPALMDGGHVRLVENLAGIAHAGRAVLAVVGYLHQLLQVLGGTLVGEATVAIIHGLLESLLCRVVVLLLQQDGGLGVHRGIPAIEAAGLGGILHDILTVVECARIVLEGSRRVDGLLAPGIVERAFLGHVQTDLLHPFGDIEECLAVVRAEALQHLGLQAQQLVGGCGPQGRATQQAGQQCK